MRNFADRQLRPFAALPGIAAALSLSLLCACGSSSNPAAVPATDSPESSLNEQLATDFAHRFGLNGAKSTLPPQPQQAGLPGLDGLEALGRGVSVSAPGWYETSVLHPIGRAGASFGPTTVTLDSVALNGLAYLLFGVNGFEPDSGPTGARFTVSGVTGEYWVGFSDYVAGEWVFSGPFSATAEAEIPNTSVYTDFGSFISPGGVHYFCIMAPLGTVLTVEKVELGVHGGSGAPRPPENFGANAFASGTIVSLLVSPDHLDPDFDGYIMQRAPLLSGDFATMFGGPTMEPVKVDFTATNAEGYRWRVCSVDTSGNQSIWLTQISNDEGSGNTPPVAHASFPTGRLFGPVDVTFDLSTSLDPDGDALTQYGIIIEPGGPVFSATPEITLTLQPGCYNIVALVKDAVAFGFNVYRLKVYPQWESASSTVRLPELNAAGFSPSLIQARVSLSPDNKLALCGIGDGFDFDVHYEVQPGLLRQWSAPLYQTPDFIGEPLWHGGVLMCPFGTPEGVFCMIFDPLADGGAGRISQLDLANSGDVLFWDPPPSSRVSISEDLAGNVWAFFQVDNSGSFDFVARNISSMSDPVILLPGLTAIEAVDSELRSDGLLEVALATAVATEELEFDPLLLTLTPLTLIAPAPLQDLDLELDPLTNLPGVVFYAPFPVERVRYFEKDGLGVWSVAVDVENAAANGPDFGFSYGASQALVGLTYGGQAALYEVDAFSSSQRNMPAGLSAVGYHMDICALNATDVAMLNIEGATGELKVTSLDAGGGDAPLIALNSTQRQGFNLQAAVEGPGNIHVTWANFNDLAIKHYYTANAGDNWIARPDLPFSATSALGADQAGHLALSWSGLGSHSLFTWDPLLELWVDEGMAEAGPADSRSCLSNDPYGGEIVWLHYNDVTTKLRATNGTPGAFGSWDVPSDLPNLWMGAIICGNGLLNVYWGLLNGGGTIGPSGGYVHWSEDGNNTWLFPPNGNDPYCLLTQVAVYGRTMAGSRYADAPAIFGIPINHVFYSTTGDTLLPQRYVYPDQDGQHVSTIDALPAARSETFTRELRRTVSAYPAWGRTAVAVISSYDGAEQYMEWSNFGEFEELQMPPIGRANYTCIVIGQDGRWHLIYHDVATDAIMSRSTL